MYIKNKLIKESFINQYLLFFIIIILPQIFFYEDLWDGTIYNYAQQIDEFDGAKLQLYEPGWVLNYWFIFLIIKIANFFKVEYYTLYILLLSILYLLFLFEVNKFIKKFLFNDKKLVSRTLFLISLFSIQSYYYSSIMLWHLFCQFSIFFGIRKFYSSSSINLIITFLFLFIGFSFKSALLYIFAISLYYNKNKIFTKKYLFLLLYGFTIFIFFHYYLNNFGRAEKYAQILNPFNFENFLIIIKSFLTYTTFLLPLGLLLFYFVIKIFFKRQKINKKIIFQFILKNKYLIIILISGIIPYVAIGRSHVIWDVEDWAGRNAILLILPISFLSIITIEFFYKLNVITKKISFYCFTFLLVFNIFFLTKGVTAKLNRIIYQNELSSIIKENKNLLNEPSGIVIFIDENKIRPIFRINEINYLTYKSIGKNNLWSIYLNSYEKNLIKYPRNNKYKNLYGSSFSSKEELEKQCLIILTLSSNELKTNLNKFLNILYKDYFQISLIKIEKKNCS